MTPIRIMGLATLLGLCLSLATVAYATDRVVYNTHLDPRPQSPLTSEANFVSSSVSINDQASPSCGNKIYIDFADKEMWATILVAHALNKNFDIWYTDSAASRYVYGADLECKLLWVDML